MRAREVCASTHTHPVCRQSGGRQRVSCERTNAGEGIQAASQMPCKVRPLLGIPSHFGHRQPTQSTNTNTNSRAAAATFCCIPSGDLTGVGTLCENGASRHREADRQRSTIFVAQRVCAAAAAGQQKCDRCELLLSLMLPSTCSSSSRQRVSTSQNHNEENLTSALQLVVGKQQV